MSDIATVLHAVEVNSNDCIVSLLLRLLDVVAQGGDAQYPTTRSKDPAIPVSYTHLDVYKRQQVNHRDA